MTPRLGEADAQRTESPLAADGLPDGTERVDSFRTPSGVTLPDDDRLQMAVDIHFPRRLIEPAVLLACLPGGAMGRGFFDLVPPSQDSLPADASFSFARQMTARGFVVALIDHLGIGGSDKPRDGYAVSGDLLSSATHHALGAVAARVNEYYDGRCSLACSVGVGHSMGALVTILQQAQFRSHRALALLGFSTRGMPEYVPQALHPLASDPSTLRARLPEVARQMFKQPYSRLESNGDMRRMFAGDLADPRGIAALASLPREPILPLPSAHAMLPGNVAHEAASIDVPVFIAAGDRDIVGPPEEVPRAFVRSPLVQLHVMPNTGHSHFLFSGRFQLFEALAVWIRSVTGNGMHVHGQLDEDRRV